MYRLPPENYPEGHPGRSGRLIDRQGRRSVLEHHQHVIRRYAHPPRGRPGALPLVPTLERLATCVRWLSLFQVLTVSALTPACAQPVQEEAGGALTRYSFTGERNESWKLPRRLREVSGLAATADDRLFTHDDERGIVYELDPTDGGVLKSFALGSPVPKDDFEGITVVDDHFFMVTSDGTLYEVPEGADGEHVLVNTFATDVGRGCEVEGLAFEPSDRTLLMLCKTPRVRELEDYVAIYRWSVDRRERVEGLPILVPLDAFKRSLGERAFAPSGIERHPGTGTYFVVAARQEAIAEITPAGVLLGVLTFPDGAHRKAEGITFLSDSSLCLSDEGRSKRARLTRYRSGPP